MLLRELREQRGWSQAQLAAQLNVAPSTVYNWEAGRVEPLFSTARKIAALFGVSMESLEFTNRTPGPIPRTGKEGSE